MAPRRPPALLRPAAAPVELVDEAALSVALPVSVLALVVVVETAAEAADAVEEEAASPVTVPDALSLATPVALALALAVPEEVLLQTTSSGTVTLAAEQICWAYLTAAALPAASHWPSRQQAMPFKKSALLQMHLTSIALHPAIPSPVVYLLMHEVWAGDTN